MPYGQPATVGECKVERFIGRWFAVDGPMPRAKTELKRLAATLTPSVRPGDFAQAMMDLGATICTPRSPRCLSCPLLQDCQSHRLGTPERFPVKAEKRARPERRGTAFWIERDGRVLLVNRPPKGLQIGRASCRGRVGQDV